jgi:hypothetical protein
VVPPYGGRGLAVGWPIIQASLSDPSDPGAGYVRVRKEIGADEEEHGGVKKNKGKKETRRM